MILERYLFREIAHAFLGVFTVLVLIFVTNRFVRYLADAAQGTVVSSDIAALVALKLTVSLTLILPLSFFLAALLALGRLYKDSEVTAMSASGVGDLRFLRAVGLLSLGFAVVVLAISLFLAPRATRLADDLAEAQGERSNIAGIFAGRFKTFSEGEKVFFAEDIAPDRREMRNLFVQVQRPDQTTVVASDSGYQRLDPKTGDRFLVMVDGHRYEGRPGDPDYRVTGFRLQAVRIEERTVTHDRLDPDGVDTLDLLGSRDPRMSAELQWRLSMPLSLVLLAALAVPLAHSSPRKGRYARLLNAILIYFVYNNLLGVARKLAEQGKLPLVVGIWPVHLVMVALIALMLFYRSSGRWRLAAMLRRLRERA